MADAFDLIVLGSGTGGYAAALRAATLGKNVGSDANNDKSTYPSTLGVEGARQRAAETQQRATDALRSLRKDSSPLLWLSDFILKRSY